MQPSAYLVLADYEVIDPHPLQVDAGSTVSIVKEDISWPGWVWVASGNQRGWMPACHLETSDASERRVVTSFDGTDLSAKRGDRLEALETVSGWVRARAANGGEGWFPLFNLRPLED